MDDATGVPHTDTELLAELASVTCGPIAVAPPLEVPVLSVTFVLAALPPTLTPAQ